MEEEEQRGPARQEEIGGEPEDKEIIQILTGVPLIANPVLTH